MPGGSVCVCVCFESNLYIYSALYINTCSTCKQKEQWVTASLFTRGPTQIPSNFVRPKVFGPQDFGPSHGPVVVSHTLCAHVRLYTG